MDGTRVGFVATLVLAATEVLEAELGGDISHSSESANRPATTSGEVTAIVGVTGRVRGLVLFSMSKATALGIASRMCGQEFKELDSLARSGVAELGNVITGRATTLLAEQELALSLSPPVLIMGLGATISLLEGEPLVVKFTTEVGGVEVGLSLKEADGILG